jgi:hypothetical protein
VGDPRIPPTSRQGSRACSQRHHGDAIGAPVAIAAAADHRQEGGFAAAAGIDLLAKAQQAGGGGLHLARSELDLDRAPAAIAQLHDRVHLNAVVVAVVEHLALQRLGKHPQVANHQRLEQQPQPLQILEQTIGAAAEGRHRQRGVAEVAPGGLAQGSLGTQMGPPGGLDLQHHQPLQGLEQHCTGGAQAGAQLSVGDAGTVGQSRCWRPWRGG